MDDLLSAAEIFNRYATEYQERFMDTSLYHDGFDAFCRTIAVPGAAVLDIACGPGNISRYLLDTRPDFRLLGIDLAPQMVELAARNNPGAVFRCMDCRDISGLGQMFSGIMGGFVLPYLNIEETRKLIADAAALLTPGGAFYLSTMEKDYSQSGIQQSSKGDRVMMYFYTEALLSDLLRENGFSILEVQRKVYGDVTDLVLIAVKSA